MQPIQPAAIIHTDSLLCDPPNVKVHGPEKELKYVHTLLNIVFRSYLPGLCAIVVVYFYSTK